MSDATFCFRGHYLGIAKRKGWEFATRINASAVAVMVPLTDAGEVVLVEQYRLPVARSVIELPAGLVGDLDDPEEPIIEAAQRELVEETGYRAGTLTPLLECPSSAGMSDEVVTFFLAERLQRAGPGGGDDSEDIRVHEVPLATASEWLGAQRARGLMIDPKVYTGLYWLERRCRGVEPCP